MRLAFIRCPTLRSLLNELARLTIKTIVKRASSFNRDLRVIRKSSFSFKKVHNSMFHKKSPTQDFARWDFGIIHWRPTDLRIAKLLGKLRALIDIVMSLLAAGGFSHPSKRVLPSLCKTHCYFCYFFVRFMYGAHAIITRDLYIFKKWTFWKLLTSKPKLKYDDRL